MENLILTWHNEDKRKKRNTADKLLGGFMQIVGKTGFIIKMAIFTKDRKPWRAMITFILK